MFALAGRRRQFILFLLLFLLALLPRLAALERYVTPDELNWVYRSIGLRQALLSGEWGETIRSGHPGVTTTWLGAAAIQLQLWLEPASAVHLNWLETLHWLAGDSVEAYRHLAVFLDSGRIAIALATSLGVAACFWLAMELVGTGPALLGALLLAFDPFLAGLSGLLHVDALLATFMLLALLLALRARRFPEKRRQSAVWAGLMTGLALLTKTPALLLLPLIGFILLPFPLPRPGLTEKRDRLGWLPVSIWALSLLLTCLLLLPALWSAPRVVLETVSGLSGRLVEEAVRPTFFLGEMGLNHGPLFYPLALFFRLSPAATVGLVLLLVSGWRTWLENKRPVRATIGWHLLFALLFLLLITLVAKKHDRYALPALASLTLVAGWSAGHLASNVRPGLRQATYLLLPLLQLVVLFTVWPYPLTAYNWFGGGERVAALVLPSGWGEGASVAARWLAENGEGPDGGTLFASNTVSTAPFYAGAIYRLRPAYLTLLEREDYLLRTAGERQGGTELEAGGVATILQAREPLHTISFNGRERAWLYSGLAAADLGLPTLSPAPLGYQLDGGPRLVAGGAAFLAWPQETLVTLHWVSPSGLTHGGYRLQLQLRDEADNVRTEQEQPLLNAAGQPPAAWPVGVPQVVYYTQQLPPDLPPGEYHFVARVFDAQGAQQGVFDSQALFAGTEVTVAPLAVTAPSAQPPLSIPYPYQEQEEIAGHEPLPERASSGTNLSLGLWWQSDQPSVYQLALSLGDATDGEITPWPLDTRSWVPGQKYHIYPQWRLPAGLADGRYPLRLWLLDGAGEALWAAPASLGEIEIENEERNFELPANLVPLQVQGGSLAKLQDVSVRRDGLSVEVETIWQTVTPTDVAYTAFVHLLDDAGNVVAQVDRPPQPPTTSWVDRQVVTNTYSITLPDAEGPYRIATGLYDPGNGLRLPLYDAQGAPLPDNQYLVEVPTP